MKLSINELAKKVAVSNGCVRNWSLKINVGDVFTENYCNLQNVKNQLVKLFNGDTEKLNSMLGFDYNELEIIRNERKESSYISIKDLEEGNNYILRHYHYEKEVTYLSNFEEDNTTLYLFKTLDGKYEVYSISELENEKLNIKEAE